MEKHLSEVFPIGAAQEGSFKHTGLEINTALNGDITITQRDYLNALKQFHVPKERRAQPDAPLSPEELSQFRSGVSALAWAATHTQPCIPGIDQGKARLWRGDEGVFAPRAGEGDLSLAGRQFVAGVLAHARALCALAAPTVNSYKRLTVGESLSGTTWAPAYIAHGPNNRTAMVRTLPGRFEWRVPDASVNPYLATAALIAAGLDGIDRGLDPGPACTDDLFDWPLSRIKAQGIGLLPQSLNEALDALEADPVICAALGETLSAEFTRLKRAEWTAYARHVSGWELERYAAAF